MRTLAYGERRKLSVVDKYGAYLSTRRIVSFARKHSPKRVVDIGCGYDALLLERLRPYCPDLIGVDVRTNKSISGIRLIDCVIRDNLSFLADEDAHFIIMNNVLEHLDCPQDILNDAYRALAPGGTLMVNVPSWFGKKVLEFSAFRMGWSAILEINDHKMYYDVEDLWPLLVKAGFRPIDICAGYHKFHINTFCRAQKAHEKG